MATTKDDKDSFNGVIFNIDNNETAKTGEMTLGSRSYNLNGRTNNTHLGDEFKLDNYTIITLLNQPSDMKGFVGLREMTKEDYVKNVFTNNKSKNWIGSRNGLSNQGFSSIRFGVLTDRDNISYLFVHGKPAFVATSGTYKGSAIYGKDGQYRALQDAVVANVNVDRAGVGTVDINIKVDDNKTLSFGGNSTGNIFEGTKNGIETKGGFFGNYDLGGAFQVIDGADKGNHGVFGATSDSTVWKENRK